VGGIITAYTDDFPGFEGGQQPDGRERHVGLAPLELGKKIPMYQANLIIQGPTQLGFFVLFLETDKAHCFLSLLLEQRSKFCNFLFRTGKATGVCLAEGLHQDVNDGLYGEDANAQLGVSVGSQDDIGGLS
jgi:hypothetical protein